MGREIKLSKADGVIFKKLNVAAVILFGSRAHGRAREKSDYDIGVLFKNPKFAQKMSQATYQQFYEIFAERIGKLVNIDIVFLDKAPIQLCYHVLKHGKVLFETDSKARAKFYERVMLEHADFEVHRRLFEESTLKRVA